MIVNLSELKVGDVASVVNFDAVSAYFRQRMLAYGLIPGKELAVVRAAPLGDPIQLELEDGIMLTLRRAEGRGIKVKKVTDERKL